MCIRDRYFLEMQPQDRAKRKLLLAKQRMSYLYPRAELSNGCAPMRNSTRRLQKVSKILQKSWQKRLNNRGEATDFRSGSKVTLAHIEKYPNYDLSDTAAKG